MTFYKLRRVALLTVLTVFAGVCAYAQGIVKGVVKNDKGEPIVGATVRIGTIAGAMSGEDGSYALKSVPTGTHLLEASSIDYKKFAVQIVVAEGKVLVQDISMVEDVMSTDEVVVVGYGVQRKRDLVGSVVKINGGDIQPGMGASFETGLQGKASGVQVIQGSGTVGAASTIRVRGTGSISASGDPLYVIDGIPITQNYNNNQGISSDVQNNPLQFLNSNDIESIEILKDASAIAIYGSRGANGVILITTKRGKAGKPQISINVRGGAGSPTALPQMLNADEWVKIRQEAWENDGGTGRAPLPRVNGVLLNYNDIKGINTNWYDQVLRTGTKSEVNGSIKWGNKLVQLYGAGGYSNNQGFQINNGMKRTNGRINVDITPIKGLTISVNSSVALTNLDKIQQQYNGALGYAMSSALPILPVTYDKLIENAMAAGDTAKAAIWRAEAARNGNLVTYNNPALQLQALKWQAREVRQIHNARINYTPVKNLTLSGSFNYEAMDLWDYQWRDSLMNGDRMFDKNDPRVATRRTQKSEAWNTRTRNVSAFLTTTYNYDINENHKLTAMGGTEFQTNGSNTGYRGYLANTYGDKPFLNQQDGFPDIDSSTTYFPVNGTWNPTTKKLQDRTFNDSSVFFSMFARINYSYKNKLMVQATIRRDGSSKFGSNNRFGNFPSVGVGYILTEEGFLKDNSVINYLKLKASVGITGNATIDWRQQYGIGKIVGVQGFNDRYGSYPGDSTYVRYLSKLPNQNLKWENNTSYDIGFDFGLFKDRITGDFSYYFRKTTGAAVATKLQVSSGIDDVTFYQNAGIVDNWGVEFNVATRNIVRPNFGWKTTFNISHNNNRVISNGNIPPDALDGGYGDMRVIEGYPVTTPYLVEFVRVDAATGRPVYLDKEGNETFVYDETPKTGNRRAIGKQRGIQPLFYGSLGNEFRYKQFDLNFMFVFSYGNKIYDDAGKRYLGAVNFDNNDFWNYRRDIIDHWTPDNTDAQYPKLTTTIKGWGNQTDTYWNNNSTIWLRDASYIRLRTLNLGYTVNTASRLKVISALRFSIAANNILTITKLYGIDPETARFQDNNQKRNIGGVGNSFLNTPQEKSIMFSINADF